MLSPETQAYLQAYSDGVNAYLHDHTPVGDLAGVHRARPAELRLQGRGLDAGGLGRVAQGDGVGPARQHGRRDRARPDVGAPDAGRDRRAVPGVPLRPAPADRRPGRRRRQGLRAGRHLQQHAQAVPPAARPGRASARCRGCSRCCAARPRCSARATASARTPGWSTATTPRPASRSWPTTRTCPPRCRASGTRWGCTARPCRTSARSTSPASPSPVSRAWSSATTSRSPGASRTSAPTCSTSTWRRWRTRATCTTGGCARCGCGTRRSRSWGGRSRSGSPCARPGTARCSPTSPPSSARSAPTRRRATTRPRAATATPSRSRGPRCSPSNTADAIFEIDRATDWQQFRSAASDFAVPSQNLVYADRDGNIGYQAPGRIPIRKSGNTGDYPALGWLKADDWTGKYVPFAALPSVLNPSDGLVATANQAVDRPGLPLLPGRLLGLRLPQPADRRPAPAAGEGQRRGHVPDPARHPQRVRADVRALPAQDLHALAVPRRRPAAAERLGLPAGPGVGGSRLLQRRLDEHARADLPRRAQGVGLARRRRSLVRGDAPAARRARTATGGTT